ncbi:MAG TPA: hypothetical protein VFZ23_09585 [Pyrinomonadaceae bacterium]
MKSIKCKSCGLTNFPSDTECRRCGYSFVPSSANKRNDKRPRSFSIWSLVMVAIVVGIAYYLYTGVQRSVDEINANEAKRVASQPEERPATPGLSRSEYDRQRSGHYGDAVKNSSSLKAHEQRTRETEKTIQQISNSR